MGDGSERREARRFMMTLPVRVFPQDSNGPELNARTPDVSYRGLYFLADAKFDVRSAIEFVNPLPETVTQSGHVKIHCHGLVVRVESSTNGHMGVAAKIDRYEFLHAAA